MKHISYPLLSYHLHGGGLIFGPQFLEFHDIEHVVLDALVVDSLPALVEMPVEPITQRMAISSQIVKDTIHHLTLILHIFGQILIANSHLCKQATL